MTNQTTTTTPAVRGRPFPKGNGGRRLGSKNRSSLIFAALSDDDKEDVVRKGLELAKAGDVSMLKFFLGRILPRERSIRIDLPQMELCRAHHREVHRSGNEESWWWTTRIDPLAAARSLALA